MPVIGQQTVGELAARSLAAVGVLERQGIDYCCGGQSPLDEICAARGIDASKLLAEIEAAERSPGAEDRDWRGASLTELAVHIQARHHEYLKSALPALASRLEAVQRAHGERHGAALDALAAVFAALREELEMHMGKEERVLFPFVDLLERHGGSLPPPPFGTVRNPIRMMEHEHDNAGAALAEMRRITQDFAPPPDGCATFRALYEGLAELERDLHLHIHLENNILFPRAIELERAARS